ncbi:TIGR01177 family methyltransferase [Thermoplasma acidophilum]|uniref:TIGR01177 family methyltransferase n=1 Tax=Thermoplasma acidophilum TaxID=2303 RepID=UPI00064FDF87|nr:TIGR01177 family methyltransferase [Thermoplasma acidophilum]
MIRYLVEFSLERDEARLVEIASIQETYGTFLIEHLDEKTAIISGSWDPLRRCAFVNYVGLIVGEAEDLSAFQEGLPAGKFYIRYRDIDGDKPMSEAAIGDMLKARGRVSFRDPDYVVRVVHHGIFYVTKVVYERDKKQFIERKAPRRPFFSPVSMDPKYARFLVNTAHVRENQLLIDPFCGTGGILIEAALMGIRVIGNDVALSMAAGARTNLKHFHVEDFHIYNMDVSDLPVRDVDGIATDMPYGRNSYASEDLEVLYERSFRKFHEMLKPHGYASFVVSDPDLAELARPFFNIVHDVPVYQHRSLTRHFITAMRKD